MVEIGYGDQPVAMIMHCDISQLPTLVVKLH